MRKRIIKAGVLAAVFIAALLVSSLLINRGTDDKIVDMGAPALPRVSFFVGGTEVNPLFRLVGLLPIYHVMAISLLSIEQMENGMLYAVWAIPVALLFLGIGAGVSRRVFAKHQVS